MPRLEPGFIWLRAWVITRNRLRELKALTGVSMTQLIDYAVDEYFKNVQRKLRTEQENKNEQT